jgi:DNA-binding transcriptional LysR family regulator
MSLSPAALDHLRLRSLRLLQVLTESGSLRRAAEAMNTTQPALSAMLNDLEHTLGGRLFERSRRGLRPTELGQFAARQAAIVLSDIRRLRDEVSAQTQGHALLRVGVLPLLMLDIVPSALANLRRHAPWLRIEFHEASVSSLVSLLREGSIDLVVGRMTAEHSADRELERLHLFSERLCVLADRRHPMAKMRKIDLQRLCDGVWILPPADTILRQTFIEAFLRRGLQPPSATFESASFYSSINIMMHTDCLMVAPRTVAAHYTRHRKVAMLKANLREAAARIDIIKRRSRSDSHGMDLFIESVRLAAATTTSSSLDK